MSEVKITRFTKGIPKVSICIPLWKHDKWYDQAVQSIKDNTEGIDYEIVTAECAQSVALNRNAAQRAAVCDIICQYDGDADVTDSRWLLNMYETLMSDKKIGVVGAISVFPDGKVDHPGTILTKNREETDLKIDLSFPNAPDNVLFMLKERIDGRTTVVIPYERNKEAIDGKVYDVFQCTGVAMLYDRRVSGEFCESLYQGSGWDDMDFLGQMRHRGYRIVVDGRVRFKHPNHIRSQEEIDIRQNPSGGREFKVQNLINYMLKWGDM